MGNNGDGHLALLLGGSGGLSLSQTLVSAEAPNPTSLSFAGVSDGQLNFYVSTAGREAAMNLVFNLDGGTGLEDGLSVAPTGESSLSVVLTQATTGSVQQVSQLLSVSGTTLDLAATLLTVSVVSSEFETGSSGGISSVGTTGFGQPVGQPRGNGASGTGAEPSEDAGTGAAGPPPVFDRLPAWEQISIGLERAWEQARAALLDLESPHPAAAVPKSSARPAANPPRARAVSPRPGPTGPRGRKPRRCRQRRPGRPGRPGIEWAAGRGNQPGILPGVGCNRTDGPAERAGAAGRLLPPLWARPASRSPVGSDVEGPQPAGGLSSSWYGAHSFDIFNATVGVRRLPGPVRNPTATAAVA